MEKSDIPDTHVNLSSGDEKNQKESKKRNREENKGISYDHEGKIIDQAQETRNQLRDEGIHTDPLKKTNTGVDANQEKITLNTSTCRIGPTISSFGLRAERSLPIIDKTGILYKLLIESNDNSAFVIGPRRFGKSMGAQTVQAIFAQDKKWWTSYCKDLSIVKMGNYDFPIHPVLNIDFSTAKDLKRLSHVIFEPLERLINQNDLKDSLAEDIKSYKEEKTFDNVLWLFEAAIPKIAEKQGRGVVIIIDEYDYPLISAAEELILKSDHPEDIESLKLDEETTEKRESMKMFFEKIKSFRQQTFKDSSSGQLRSFVHFFYLTGIVPLNQTGLFSGPNDVFDVRSNQDYAEILGYTEEDIKTVFKDNLSEMTTNKMKKDSSEQKNTQIQDIIMEEIRKNYNGFRFTFEQKKTLYSPYAINYLFANWHPDNDGYPPYFGKSGSSRLIMMSVQRMPIMEKTKFFQSLMDDKGEETLSTCDSSNLLEKKTLKAFFGDPAALGFFSGAFTLQIEGSTKSKWNLKITNEEMRKTLWKEIDSQLGLSASFKKMTASLENVDFTLFFKLLNDNLTNMSAFSNPSKEQYKSTGEFEGYGHTLFVLLLERFKNHLENIQSSEKIKSLQFISNKSVDTSKKRPDCWIIFEKTKEMNQSETIALMIEFKCNVDLEVGLKEAGQDLLQKFSDTKEKTKPEYYFLKSAQTTYVACAIGFGTIQGVEFYKLTKQNEKEVLTKANRWVPK